MIMLRPRHLFVFILITKQAWTGVVAVSDNANILLIKKGIEYLTYVNDNNYRIDECIHNNVFLPKCIQLQPLDWRMWI